MHVVRHYDERVELVSAEAPLAVLDSFHDEAGNFRLTQKQRAECRAIKQAVHRHECLSRAHSGGRKSAAHGEAVSQAECNEKWLPDYIPVGEAALIVGHTGLVGSG